MHVLERHHDWLKRAASAVCERLDGELDSTPRSDRGAALLASRAAIAALQERASRLVEAVLREQQRNVRAFEEARSALVITDHFGFVLRANAAAGRILGRAPAALVGSSLVNLARIEERASLRQALAKAPMHDLEVPLGSATRGPVAARARIRPLPTVSAYAEFCWQIRRDPPPG